MKTKTREPRWLYMHTVNDFPAEYTPGYQISYGLARIGRFATSLLQIRREQALSARWRASQGFGMDSSDYGHIRIDAAAIRAILDYGEK